MIRSRNNAGQHLLEYPLVIWVIFVVLLFPLINYCTVGIRMALVFSACNQAALQASKARTYSSAVTTAQSVATADCSSWTGITLNSTTTQIVTTNLTSLTQARQTGALGAAPDLANNTYQIEVTLNTAVSPLMTVVFPPNVPGMSIPMPFLVTQRNYVENTQGLTN